MGCHFLLQCMKVKSESEVAQSCPTLHDPMDCSLPGFSIHGIFQARVLEWDAIAFPTPKQLNKWWKCSLHGTYHSLSNLFTILSAITTVLSVFSRPICRLVLLFSCLWNCQTVLLGAGYLVTKAFECFFRMDLHFKFLQPHSRKQDFQNNKRIIHKQFFVFVFKFSFVVVQSLSRV